MNKKQWLEDMQRDFFVKRMTRQGLVAGVLAVVILLVIII